MDSRTFQLYAIGSVKENSSNKDGVKHLEINEEYRDALDQLHTFSHVIVLWWADQNDTNGDRSIMSGIIPYSDDDLEVGIFATRSAMRPNPISTSVCEIQELNEEDGIIEIGDIDADVGTPILDLKPYIPVCDRVEDVLVPEWIPEEWNEWWLPE